MTALPSRSVVVIVMRYVPSGVRTSVPKCTDTWPVELSILPVNGVDESAAELSNRTPERSLLVP